MNIRVIVKPNSKKGPLIINKTDDLGDFLEIYVRDPAVENKANLAVIKILSENFKVRKTRIKLVRGGTSKFKIFSVDI